MWRHLLIAVVTVYVLGAIPGASAQQAGPAPATAEQQAQVAAILATYANGAPLRAAIARAVEQNPSLAGAVIDAAIAARPERRLAILAGLADAESYFAKLGGPAGQAALAEIHTAMAFASVEIQRTYAFLLGVTFAFTDGFPGGGDQFTITNNCISPSRPGRRC